MTLWLHPSCRRCSLVSIPAVALVLALAGGCGGGGGESGSGGSSGTEASTGSVTTAMSTGVGTTGELPQTTSGTTMGLDDTGTSSAGAPSTESEGTSTGGSITGGSSTEGTTGGSSTEGTTGGSSTGGTTDGEPSSSGGDAFVCDGLSCIGPGDCASNACFSAGVLGGVCSECDEDADCAMGCSPGNPQLAACGFCCDGSLGCGCESSAACQAGLTCASILAVPGILATSACSECILDADCAAGQLCSPDYDLAGLIGQRVCVPPGSKGLGEGCDLDGGGAAECATGQCAVTTALGIEVMGTCAECDDDLDCPVGSCQLPTIDIGTFTVTPGTCA